MINVYTANTTVFNNNGLVVLSDCISCEVTEELNGAYECTLEYPIDLRGKWSHLVEGNLIKADGQMFRIYKKNKSLGSVKITARHIFYDLIDNFLEDVRPTSLTGAGALDWILTHTQYAHDFTSLGDVGGLDTHYYVRKNVIEAIMGSEGIISIWGGELTRDNYNISLLGQRGADRGVLVSYKKNIEGIEEDLDLDGITTRIMPIGKDGLLLPEKYIDSQYINNFPHPKIRAIDFSEIAIEADLRAAAVAYYTSSKCDIPESNHKVNFIELSKTDQYKNYAVLERVFLGDIITIRHARLGIDLQDKIIKTTKDVLTDRLIKIELGSFKENLATTINNAIQEVKQDIVRVKSAYQLAIENATNLITGSEGGNVVIRQNESGQPYEILIMDTTDVMTCLKCWRWNLGGLGYSETGIEGPFDTAITMDGAIVGKFITALLITGEQINGGIIKGVRIQQVDGTTILADLFKDANGGKLVINDNSGNLNIKLGSENGISNPSNVGGTLILYEDSIDRQRAALAITANTHGGYLTLEDSSDRLRASMMADNVNHTGPHVAMYGTDGISKSWMTDLGIFGVGRKPMTKVSLTIPLGTSIQIDHLIGYIPIVVIEGANGTYILTVNNTSLTRTWIMNGATSAGDWTGTVSFY